MKQKIEGGVKVEFTKMVSDSNGTLYYLTEEQIRKVISRAKVELFEETMVIEDDGTKHIEYLPNLTKLLPKQTSERFSQAGMRASARIVQLKRLDRTVIEKIVTEEMVKNGIVPDQAISAISNKK